MREAGASAPAGFRRAMAVAGIGMAVAAAATSRALVVAGPTSSHRAGAYPDVAALRQAPARWRAHTALQEGRAAFEGQSDAPADRLDRDTAPRRFRGTPTKSTTVAPDSGAVLIEPGYDGNWSSVTVRAWDFATLSSPVE